MQYKSSIGRFGRFYNNISMRLIRSKRLHTTGVFIIRLFLRDLSRKPLVAAAEHLLPTRTAFAIVKAAPEIAAEVL